MDFKRALLISFMGHCVILTPLGNLWLLVPNKKTNNVQVNYYKLPPPKIETAKEVVSKRITEPINTAQIPKEERLIIEKPKMKKSQIVKRPRPSQAKPPDLKPKEKIVPSSIPGTTLPNTPECVEYYQYIREEIRRFLKRNYTPEYEEGDVGIAFALNHAGELVSLNIIEDKSCDDSMLRKLSYESIRMSAPFKSFPKGLVQNQISFSLVIVFKHK